MSTPQVPGWTHSSRPEQLFRRFPFESYAQTRRFLDEVAHVSEQMGVTPQNINFGTTHVNITIAAVGQALTEQDLALAQAIGALAPAAASVGA